MNAKLTALAFFFLASTAGAALADNDPHQQAVRMITSGSDISTPRAGSAVPKEILIAGEGDAQAKAAALLNHLQPNGTTKVGGPVLVLTQVPQDGHASARDLLAHSVAKEPAEQWGAAGRSGSQ